MPTNAAVKALPTAESVLASLTSAFAQRTPSGVQSASVVAEHLRAEPLRSELERLLDAGHSRTAIAEALSQQYARSIPTIRAALDEIFPRVKTRKSAVKRKSIAPVLEAKTAAIPRSKPVIAPPKSSVAPHAGSALAEV